MEQQHKKNAAKLGAYAIAFGSVCMLSGAAIMGAAGADLDQSLYDGEIAGYLSTARFSQNLLILNLSLWITGVISLGLGATMTTLLSEEKPVWVQLVRYNYGIAVPLVVVSYMDRTKEKWPYIFDLDPFFAF